MFQLFKGKNNKITLGAPIQGEAVPISAVSDPTFGEEILGKGIAIKPSIGRVVAPADGVINIMFDTKHAISMTTDTGVEILIHIGLDTVKLGGEHFTSHVQADDKVKAGDLLLEFNIDKIQEAGYDIISPIVICNTADYKDVVGITGHTVQPLDEIIQLMK
ncbi:MAG: PTS glucose transporter subunit IIA [Lachnospiraceae bacterium]